MKELLQHRRLLGKTPVIIGLLVLGFLGSYGLILLEPKERCSGRQTPGIGEQRETFVCRLTYSLADGKLYLVRILTNKKYRLTVVVDSPELFKSIEVYSGAYAGVSRSGDPRYGTHTFGDAKLVSKSDRPSGSVTYILEPGRYFIYPLLDYDSQAVETRTPPGIYGQATEVYLDRDVEIAPGLYVAN